MSRNCSKIDSDIMQRLKKMIKMKLMRLNEMQINLVSYWLNKKKKKGTGRKGTLFHYY